jgi:hypothetical protein
MTPCGCDGKHAHGTILVEIGGSGKPITVDVSENQTLAMTDPKPSQTIQVTVDRP